jgi:haloalkane dehalogenase
LAWATPPPPDGNYRFFDHQRYLDTPKLFIDAEPAGFLIKGQRDSCRAWPNQQIVTVRGAHFLQEEAPREVGEATAKFVSNALAGQIS